MLVHSMQRRTFSRRAGNPGRWLRRSVLDAITGLTLQLRLRSVQSPSQHVSRMTTLPPMPVRDLALDVLRGGSVAGMILVNTPGSWAHVYAPLRHADWHGLTPTDLVFPFFLFIVGAAMAHTLHRVGWERGALLRAALRRGVLLIAIGVLLNAYPFLGGIDSLRLPGVLQRIGLCILIATPMLLWLRGTRLWLGALILLTLYLAAMLAGGADQAWTLEHNAVRRLDLAVFGASHLWQGYGLAFDPEGLLSTLPAVLTVLIGHACARALHDDSRRASTPRWLALTAALLAVGGLCIAPWIPVNKALWTPSFVGLSAAAAIAVLLALRGLLRLAVARRLSLPLQAYGLNPLLLYVLAWLWAASYPLIRIGEDDLQTWLFTHMASALPPALASLLFALAHVLALGALALWLMRRRIVVRL